MANQVFRGAGRLTANTMFGRSNSLSINTGAANSTLYASSSHLPSTPTSAPRNPPKPRPSLIGSSIYHQQPTTPAGPSKLRNEWKDDPPSTPDDYRQRPGDDVRIYRDASSDEAPWLNPNWKPPAGPDVATTGASSTPSNSIVAPPAQAPQAPFNSNSNFTATPAPAIAPPSAPASQASTSNSNSNFAPAPAPVPVPAPASAIAPPSAPPVPLHSKPAPTSAPPDSDGPTKKRTGGVQHDTRNAIANDAPWLDPEWKPPAGPQMPTREETGPTLDDEGWTVADPNRRFTRPDLMGPGPRKMLTPHSGSQQQAGGSQPQQGGSLFGNNNNTAATQTTQPQAGGSLFGGSLFGGNQQTQNQQSTQQPATGGLFGNTQQNQNQQEQKPATGGLFGGAQTTQTQQPAGGSLFGGMQSTNKPAGGLFGNTTTQQPSGGLFGNSTAQQPAPGNGSLFGGLNQSQIQQQQQQQPQQATQPSLLGASRYHQSQYQPFVTGRLTMGQGQGGAPQPTATPATKLDWSNVRSTTRFNDLTDEAKQDIEKIDKLISEQEQFCKQIEAFLPNHGNNLQTLGPDVDLITEKLEEIDRSLAVDAQGVQQDKNITEKDEIDIARCIRIIDNLRMPSQYIYHPAANSGRQPQPPAWDETYDVDLVGNYFQPMIQDMARLLATYSGNMSEIENHMGTIEQSTVAQAQQLGAQRSGLGGQRDVGADSVRQLADTLRGFEASILAAAGKVGSCRDGVNDLVLGKASGSQAARRGW
jgi:nucleoporin p58/p45